MDSNISSRPTQDNAPATSSFRPNVNGRHTMDRLFAAAAWTATGISVAILAWLLLTILIDGLSTLNWNFIESLPSRKAEDAGIIAALVGTLWLMALVAAISFPVGVGAGIFLEEFTTKDNWLTQLIEINIGNLAGVPSIIYGSARSDGFCPADGADYRRAQRALRGADALAADFAGNYCGDAGGAAGGA